MSNVLISKSTLRKQYGKIKDVVPVPNLIEIQSTSFNDFVQLDYLPQERKLIGLEIEFSLRVSLEYFRRQMVFTLPAVQKHFLLAHNCLLSRMVKCGELWNCEDVGRTGR